MKRGIPLGLVLGLSALTHSATILFIPIVILMMIARTLPSRKVAWKTILAICLSSLMTICPWTLRNYSVFGHVVPVRTGAGLNLHQGSPILAGMFAPGPHACTDTLGPIWEGEAQNVRDTIRLSRQGFERRKAIYKRSYDCIEQEAPEGYENFNEAERDKVYLKKFKKFVLSEPRTFAILTFYKILSLFASWNRFQAIVGLLAPVGMLISWRNQRTRVLALFVLAYTIPCALAV